VAGRNQKALTAEDAEDAEETKWGEAVANRSEFELSTAEVAEEVKENAPEIVRRVSDYSKER